MHTFKNMIVAATALVLFTSPALVTKAGSDPTSSASLAEEPPISSAFTLNASLAMALSASPAEVLHLKITAYASTPGETDSTPNITANGTFVHDGVVATNLLPFGTKVKIPALFGDKIFTVDDRMSSKLNRNMDIWMPSVQEAIIFGVHYANVVVISTPPSREQLSLR